MNQSRLCDVSGCDRDDIKARGMCGMHYARWNRGLRGEELAAPSVKEQLPCIVEGCGRQGGWSNLCPTHYKQWRRQRMTLMVVASMGGECEGCGEQYHPSIMHFHHRDPDNKSGTVGRLLTSRSWDSIVEEARKCDLLCPNCHALLHHREHRLTYNQGTQPNKLHVQT